MKTLLPILPVLCWLGALSGCAGTQAVDDMRPGTPLLGSTGKEIAVIVSSETDHTFPNGKVADGVEINYTEPPGTPDDGKTIWIEADDVRAFRY